MKNFCIYGEIGSGKSIFCKNIMRNKNISHSFPRPLFHIEIDEIVHYWHHFSFIKKKLYRNWKKGGISIFYGGSKKGKIKRKKHILFFSSKQQKKRAWNILEQLFHPLITQFIAETQKKTRNNKGSLLWDMALPEIFPQNHSDEIIFIHISSKSLYETLFSLKKYRNFSYEKTLFFLKKQKRYKK